MNLLRRRFFIFANLIILLALYALFDGYINNIAKESLTNWIKVEQFSIAEGNLLTSVTKNQRMMLSSEFIKGVVLLDFSKNHQLEQIEFGEKVDPKFIDAGSHGISLKRVGLFHRYAYAKIPNHENMAIVFSVWSQGLINVFAVACALFVSLFVFCSYIIWNIEKREYKIREKQTIEYANKAARAAHDIRSPLTVLNSLVSLNNQVTAESKEQLTRVIESLRDVTRDLVDDRSSVVKPKTTEKLVINPPLSLKRELEIILENKSIQYARPEITIESEILDISKPIKIDRMELRRSLSNILDNSFDAISKKGTISFRSYEKDNLLHIEIKDSGKGIPKNVLSSIGQKGFSFDKKNGSGMGVHFTKENLESIGGSFKIESQENIGTKAILGIPILQSKLSSKNVIELEANSQVFVLDDSPSIIETWKWIFREQNIADKVEITYFSKPKEILEAPNKCSVFLLTDFDLQDRMDGLDVVASMGLTNASLLVTGMAEDKTVQAKAQTLGVPVLSKESLSGLKIVVV